MDEKRLEILERSSAVYMKFGIKSVTMDDLARELGMSKKTIYKYFEDKSDLVRSIVEMKMELERTMCIGTVQISENAIDNLIAISKLIVEQVGTMNPSVFFDLKKYHPDAWQFIDDHRTDFVMKMIINNVNQGISEGLFRKSLDAEIIGRLYVSSIDNIFNPDIFPWPQFTIQAVYSEMIRLHIKGLVNEDGLKYLTQKIDNGEF